MDGSTHQDGELLYQLWDGFAPGGARVGMLFTCTKLGLGPLHSVLQRNMFGGRRSFRRRGGNGKTVRVGHILPHNRIQRCHDAQTGYNFDVIISDETASIHEK